METDRDASALKAAADFLRRFWRQAMAISAGLLIPCFWHRRIEAGDLGSHVYNAWLAQLIERGQAPGLYLARQWNNVLFDLLLLKLGNVFGLAGGAKIVGAALRAHFLLGRVRADCRGFASPAVVFAAMPGDAFLWMDVQRRV